MGMEGIGRDNSNIERLSKIQGGEVSKAGGKGAELELPSALDVRKELAAGPGEVNTAAIKAHVEGVEKGFSNDLRDDFKGAVNAALLAPLVSDGVALAAITVAEAFQNANKEPSTGDAMIATIALTVLRDKKEGG